MDKHEKLRQKLMATFALEFSEHQETLSKGFLSLETEPDRDERSDLLAELFRAAHSLKGAARAVELIDIEQMAHRLEDVMAALKAGNFNPDAEKFDVLFTTLDQMSLAMDSCLTGTGYPLEQREAVIERLGQILEDRAISPLPRTGNENGQARDYSSPVGLKPEPKAAPTAPPGQAPPDVPNDAPGDGPDRQPPRPAEEPLAAKPAAPAKTLERRSAEAETIRISTDKLDAMMADVGEILVARTRPEHRLAELKSIQNRLARWDKGWRTVRGHLTSLKKADLKHGGLDAMLGFMEASRSHLAELKPAVDKMILGMSRDNRQLIQLTDQLQQDVHRARMLPVSSVFDLFPRMVRDLARQGGCQADLKIEGAATEVDRQVLETVKDPLIHLIRNALDHGIEPPHLRERAGKDPRGRIELSASQSGSNVIITLSDDGRGLDRAALIRAALAGGLIEANQTGELEEDQVVELMFHPNLSTKKQTTDLSGRGVGLDAVRRRLEGLNGVVEVDSRPGRGTTFRLILPLTVATSRVLIVGLRDQRAAIPISSIEKIHTLDPNEIRSSQGQAAIRLAGRNLTLYSLAKTLGISDNGTTAERGKRLPVLIVTAAEKKVAFVIDRLLGSREVVVKPLGSQLRRVGNLAGATILGSGRVVPILNSARLIKTALASAKGLAGPGLKAEPRPRKHLLVVDDSLTTRVLVKNILETAGYLVTAVADGLEAWSMVMNRDLDAVVSDIDMPRMDGFELTEKIRGQKKFQGLPVILVTSMDSDQDKARGLEVGADAYIAKGSFDQTELLKSIDRLVGGPGDRI